MPLITVEKFPAIHFRSSCLVWDSRQPASNNEWVLVHFDEHENPAVRRELMARKGAKFIGPPGSGLDLEVANTRKFLGLAAAAHYGCPSKRLKVFGVTGTNGKTTCTTLLRAQLVARGETVAELGTLGLKVFRNKNSKPIFETETGFTTADAPTLQNFFRQFAEQGITAVVMEISSHASVLGRISGTDLDGLLFTNLSQDHLDFHHSMEAYEDAKALLFIDSLPLLLSDGELREFPEVASSKEKYATLNADDVSGRRIFGALVGSAVKISTYAQTLRSPGPHEVHFNIVDRQITGTQLRLNGYGKTPTIHTNLIGDYNSENVVGSWSLLAAVGLDEANAFDNFSGAEGRMQNVSTAGRPAVFIDYSHTPDALEKALLTLRQVVPSQGKLVVAFGCGGNRDAGKRPLMGGIAAKIADQVILCSDNPRDEDPALILKQIATGISNELHSKVRMIENRETAIREAVAGLAGHDVLLIAGKGHETYQIVGNQRLHFSDAETARAALALRNP